MIVRPRDVSSVMSRQIFASSQNPDDFFDITFPFAKSDNKNLYNDFRNLLSKYRHVVYGYRQRLFAINT